MHSINYIEAKIPSQEFRCGWKLPKARRVLFHSGICDLNSVQIASEF